MGEYDDGTASWVDGWSTAGPGPGTVAVVLGRWAPARSLPPSPTGRPGGARSCGSASYCVHVSYSGTAAPRGGGGGGGVVSTVPPLCWY